MMDCLLCKSEDKEIYSREVSFGFPLVYYQCKDCGLIYQSTDESQAASPDFYTQTYRKIYQQDDHPTAKDLWVQQHRSTYLVGLVREFITGNIGRILDVGASTGTLIETFQQALGSDVIGVEPGDAYRQFAEAQGLKMYPSLEVLMKETQMRFDLISLIHVLEHLKDPVGTLQKIRRNLLADNGTLLLEVPNFYAHDSFELAHLACFTPHSLIEVLRQAGFQVKHLHCHGNPRSAMLNLYINIVAEPLAEDAAIPHVKPDRFVRLKRKIGFLYRRIIQKLFPYKAWIPLPEEKAA